MIPIVLVHDDPAVIADQLIIRFMEARPEALQAFNLIQDVAPHTTARWPVAWVPYAEGLNALDAILQHLEEADVYVSEEAHDVLDGVLDQEPREPKKAKPKAKKTNGARPRSRSRRRESRRQAEAPKPPADARAEAFRQLHLLPTAPDFLIKAAYQALAKVHHPDRGGSVEAMKKINAAYDMLKS